MASGDLEHPAQEKSASPDVADFHHDTYGQPAEGLVLDGGCDAAVDCVRSACGVTQCLAHDECESLSSIGFCLPPMDDIFKSGDVWSGRRTVRIPRAAFAQPRSCCVRQPLARVAPGDFGSANHETFSVDFSPAMKLLGRAGAEASGIPFCCKP